LPIHLQIQCPTLQNKGSLILYRRKIYTWNDDSSSEKFSYRMIDTKDREILAILLADSSTSKAEIGRRVGLAPSAISERVRRLEEDGVIEGYEVRLNAEALSKPLLAFVFVTDAKPSHGFDTAGALSKVRGLEELHKIAGDDCYLLKVRAAGTSELNSIIEDDVNSVPSVTRVRTTIVLQSALERPPLSGHKLDNPHT
jgi:Lrp/AsnC family leucine-responsive transcriptional regulator